MTFAFLFADETLVQRGTADFYCYAGLILTPDQLVEVDSVVAEERGRLGLAPTEPLKFASAARPSRIPSGEWLNSKAAVLKALVLVRAAVVAILVHERIAKGGEKAHWSFDNLAMIFDRYLASTGGVGLVIFDHSDEIRRGDVADIVSGATVIGGVAIESSRVLGAATTHVEWMHGAAAADIALGSFRYCLERPDNDVSAAMFELVSPLIWSGSAGPPDGWFGMGIDLLPRRVLSPKYLVSYGALKRDMRALHAKAVA